MKRYRLFNIDFDTRANILKIEIQDSWDEKIKKQWAQNKEKIRTGISNEFGELDGELKIKNFIDLEATPVSILAFHNRFFRQIRKSFTIGAYYPALTGACSLGERILNHLVLRLRDEFKDTPEYKKVQDRKSFQNWDLMIDVLVSWNVLLPDVAQNFRKLKTIRNQEAVHFFPDVDFKDREIALKAIKLLSQIIQGQFAFFGPQPWLIEGTKGAFFIKKEYEKHPFIKEVYLPNCVLVGPFYKIETHSGKWVVVDDYKYENTEITDQEFKEKIEGQR